MRVLVAVHGFPPTHYAGAERAAERIVRWLATNGHEVEVFTIEKLDASAFKVETSDEQGFPIHRLYYNIKKADHFRNLYDYSPAGETFRQILTSKRFDLVHLVSGYLLGGQVIHSAKDAGVPVVVTLTEYWFLCKRLNLLHPSGKLCVGPESDAKCARCLLEDQRRFRLPAAAAPGLMDAIWPLVEKLPVAQDKEQEVARRRTTLRTALAAADVVISPSHFLIEKYAEFGFDTSRYIHIRHGIADKQTARQSQPSDGPLRLGYIGQVKTHKGIDLVVDAVISLLDAKANISLDIWGPIPQNDSYTDELQKRSQPYETIRWHGRYEASQLWDILSTFDVLVVPSRWYENSPTVIAEAYVACLPVIATNLGGMAEMVDHEKSGLVFELNSAQDLRRQIHRLIEEPDLLNRLRSGIPNVKTGDQEIEEIYAQYQSLLQEPS